MNWRDLLLANLRDDLNNDVPDDAISAAVEKYRTDLIEHMVQNGEIIRKKKGALNIYYTMKFRGSGDLSNPGLSEDLTEIDEMKIDVPYPEEELYNYIIVDIWKNLMRDPTWSVEYSLGSKSIKRDKRDKTDSNGLTLNHHAIIYYYSKIAGFYPPKSSEKKKIELYIKRHRLETTYGSFKVLINKYIKLDDRFNSNLLGKIYPFLEEWYTIIYFQVDHEEFFKRKFDESRK